MKQHSILFQRKYYISICFIFLIMVVICLNGCSSEKKKNPDSSEGSTEISSIDTTQGTGEESEATDENDPQESIDQSGKGEGAQVDVAEATKQTQNLDAEKITYGIDVSVYQGTIDWKKVAESGVEFAMVRVGYRTLEDGEIHADSNARYNMQEASKYGIKLGAYFFSTAISAEEARAEAQWVSDYISKYKITYPVAYDCEGFRKGNSRQVNMTVTERTDVALSFLEEIENQGYEGMFYGSKRDLEIAWEVSRLADYKIWVAQYPANPDPTTEVSDYTGAHTMWQYTDQGTVPGISKKVDVNVAYFGYDRVQEAKDDEAPESVQADVEALMKFTEVNEPVTSKDRTNLRDKPSQGSDAKVIYTLSNGEEATRTGVSNSGWSRVVFNGQTLYAVSSYLTTDMSYRKPEPEPDDGIATVFTSVNEQVTPKDAVNLRTKPTVDDAVGPVVVKVANGEVLTRTGINTDVGWSRVVYNGQTLYCVSSYLTMIN